MAVEEAASLRRFTPSNCSASVKLSFAYVFKSRGAVFNLLESRSAAIWFTLRIQYEFKAKAVVLTEACMG